MVPIAQVCSLAVIPSLLAFVIVSNPKRYSTKTRVSGNMDLFGTESRVDVLNLRTTLLLHSIK